MGLPISLSSCNCLISAKSSLCSVLTDSLQWTFGWCSFSWEAAGALEPDYLGLSPRRVRLVISLTTLLFPGKKVIIAFTLSFPFLIYTILQLRAALLEGDISFPFSFTLELRIQLSLYIVKENDLHFWNLDFFFWLEMRKRRRTTTTTTKWKMWLVALHSSSASSVKNRCIHSIGWLLRSEGKPFLLDVKVTIRQCYFTS